MKIKSIDYPGYENIIFGDDEAVNLHCIIAVHSTKLGPALGGLRIWDYDNHDQMFQDVLRLAEGMTLKNSLAGLNMGGGKAVINTKQKTPDMLRKFGELVNELNGSYITAEDVGCTIEDIEYIAEISKHASSIKGAGDPSPATALGIVRGMEAAVNFHRDEMAPGLSLKGLKVAIQGLGHVGWALCEMLDNKGCLLTVADLNEEINKKFHQKYGKKHTIVDPEDIFQVNCDIFAPCALGSVINDDTIELLNCKIVCGAANNQLSNLLAGYALKSRGIHYVPDFLVNAGGVLNIYREFGELDTDFHLANIIDGIYDRTLECLREARTYDKPTNIIAEQMANKRLI